MFLRGRRQFLCGSGGALLLAGGGVSADVGGAELAANRGRIVAACRRHWPKNSGDCSGFVRAVAGDLGVALRGQANDIVQQIAAPPWMSLGRGREAAVIAGVTAGEGKFVVAGLAAPGHGHVAVVVDYRNAFDSYASVDRDKAVAFWGSLGTVGRENARITLSWSAADLERVSYSAVAIG